MPLGQSAARGAGCRGTYPEPAIAGAHPRAPRRQVTLRTAPQDPRFPTTNQARRRLASERVVRSSGSRASKRGRGFERQAARPFSQASPAMCRPLYHHAPPGEGCWQGAAFRVDRPGCRARCAACPRAWLPISPCTPPVAALGSPSPAPRPAPACSRAAATWHITRWVGQCRSMQKHACLGAQCTAPVHTARCATPTAPQAASRNARGLLPPSFVAIHQLLPTFPSPPAVPQVHQRAGRGLGRLPPLHACIQVRNCGAATGAAPAHNGRPSRLRAAGRGACWLE